jgi:hypothetical protein
MSKNVGASSTRNPKGLHGLYRDNFTFARISTVAVSARIRSEYLPNTTLELYYYPIVFSIEDVKVTVAERSKA